MSGRIFTFYSWKGGVGRTMALANVGVQLARRGKRVLLVDWDLEAPGLEKYFLATDPETASRLSVTGVSDPSGLLGLLASAATNTQKGPSPEAWKRCCTSVVLPSLPKSKHAVTSLPLPQPLDLLGSGVAANGYASRLQSFSWPSFFAEFTGGQWLEDLRIQWRKAYDVVLIDSRTGLTDGGGVCTVQMPDTLVFVFTANSQSLDDGLSFLKGVQHARAAFAFERAPLTVVPLLARWEGDQEVDLADAWLERIEPDVAPLVETWLPSAVPVRRMLERLRVPHVARFNFGEPLPVLTHSLSDPDRPGLVYDLLAELFADGFANAGQIIEPGYRPAFDPVQATDDEIDALVRDDQARTGAVKEVVERYGGESGALIELFMQLAQGGQRARRWKFADEMVHRAVSIARDRVKAESYSLSAKRLLLSALLLQGEIRLTVGNLAEAVLGFREMLAIAERMAKADPSNAVWQRDLSVSHNKIGDVLRAQGRLDDAVAAYRASLEIAEALAAADPSNAGWRRDLSVSHERIGDVLSAQGRLNDALAAYRARLEIAEALAAADPSNAGWQRDLSVSHDRIGDVLRAQGRLDDAVAAYRASLEIAEALAAADPSNAGWQRDLAVSNERLGKIHVQQGQTESAIAAFELALDAYNRLLERNPDDIQSRVFSVVPLWRLGTLKGREGRDHLKAALEILRPLAEANRLDAMRLGWIEKIEGMLAGDE